MVSQFIPEFSIPSVILLGLITALVYYYINLRRSNLPPGPTPIPLIGNLNLLSKKKSLFEVFDDLREEYGDIYTFYFGQQPSVVLCSYDAIKEAFLTEGDTFSPHPSSFLTKHLGGGKGILSTNGAEWKANRRFTLSTLRDFGLGKNRMQTKILQELEYLKKILHDVAKSGHRINLRDPLFCSISNTISSVVFGRRFDYDDDEFVTLKTVLQDNFKSLSGMGLLNVYQWLRFLPGDMFHAKRALRNSEQFFSVIKRIADKHEDNYDKSDLQDFIDAYTKEIKKHESDPDSIFNRTQMEYTVADLFMAGSETTTTLMYWLFAYLANYPDLQEDLAKDINKVIGTEREPTMADKKSLPLMEATIMETLRHCDMIGTGFPHCPAADVKFRGYDIPKNTPVVPLMHGVTRDKQLWGDPDNFRPSRWLDEEGNFSKPEHAIFFFIGKRSCIGESLARMNSFLFTTSILQKFRVSAPDGEEKPSLVGCLGLTYAPQDYDVKISLRT